MAYRAATKLHMTYEWIQLLPKNDSTYINHKNFLKTFGENDRILFIGIKDSSILKLENFNKWYDFGAKIKEIKGTEHILSISSFPHIQKNDSLNKLDLTSVINNPPETQEELDSLLEIVHSLKFYEGYLFAKTDTSYVTVMAVTIKEEVINTKRRRKYIQELYSTGKEFSNATEISVHYSGMPCIRDRILNLIAKELTLFTILAAIILSIILFLFFRSIRVVFISLIVTITSVIWGLGLMTILGYDLTVLLGFLPPIVIVIGIPNCIFLINKYQNEYKNHGNKIKALSQCIEKIGNATFMTNLTTAAGCAALIITSGILLRQFGIVASLNIMITYLLSLCLIPIFFSYSKPPAYKQLKHLDNKNIKFIVDKLIKYSLEYKRRIYIVSVIVVVISLIGLRFIQTSGNLVDDVPKKDAVYVDLVFFEKYFKGVIPLEIIIDTKNKNGVFNNNAATIYKIRKLQKILTRDSTFSKYISRPVSIVDALSYSYQAHKGGKSKYYLLPSYFELKKLRKYVDDSFVDNLESNLFIDSANQIARINTRVVNIGTNEIQQLKNSIIAKTKSIFNPEEYNITITGTSIVYAESTNYLLRNLVISLGLAIVLISLFMAWMFSSVRMIIVSLTPNIIPLIITAAIMGYFGIHIKTSTIFVFTISFGISVDITIHFLAKYRQELITNDGQIDKSVISSLKEIGVSIIYTTIVLFCGFSIFIASSFGATAALGILVSITLLFSMLSNLLLLPAMLLSLEKKLVTKAFINPVIKIYKEVKDKSANKKS